MHAPRKEHRLSVQNVTGLTSCNAGRGQVQGLHDGIVKSGPDLRDFLVFASGMDAIGQQNDEKLVLSVNPDRCASKPSVAETMRGEVVAAGRAFRWDGPAQRAGIVRKRLGGGELRDRGALQDSPMAIYATVEKHLTERGEIRGGAKKACVTRDAAHREGIFVMNLALNQAMTQIAIKLGRGNPGPEIFGRAEGCVLHAKRREDRCTGEIVEFSAREAFHDFGHQDDAEVRVDLFGAGLIL
jgi:hypothetical protein